MLRKTERLRSNTTKYLLPCRSHIRSFNALFLSPYSPSPNFPASFKRRTGNAISNSSVATLALTKITTVTAWTV